MITNYKRGIQTEPIIQRQSSRERSVNSEHQTLVGPFQFMQLNFVDHPIQPSDDVSIEDQTIKTNNKSKISQSPYLLQMQGRSIDQSLLRPESSLLIQFSSRSQQQSQRQLRTAQSIAKRIHSKFKSFDKILPFLKLFGHEYIAISDSIVLFKPSDYISQFWVIVYFLLMIIAQLYLPLLEFTNNVSLIIVGLKIADVIIVLFSQYSEKGIIITTMDKVLRNYFKKYLFSDFALILTVIFLQFDIVNLFILCIIFIISCQIRQDDLFQTIKYQFNFNEKYVSLIYQCTRFAIIINYSISLWHHVMLDKQDTYIDAMLQVISQISLTQNMFQSDLSQWQELFCTLYEIYSIIMFTLIVKQILLIPPDNELPPQLGQFFKQNKVDSNLKQQIISNLKDIPKYSHEVILSRLSGLVLKQFHQSQRQQILMKQFPNFQDESIQKIIDVCEDIVTQPNQIIVNQGYFDDCSLFMILEGQFEIVMKSGIEVIDVKNSHFGEYSFYTQMPRRATIVSKGVGRLLRIRREDLIKQLTYIDKQHFYAKQYQITHDNQWPNQCYICGAGNHYLTKCPKMFYQPDHELLIKRYNYPKQQSRINFHRQELVAKCVNYKRKEVKCKSQKAFDFYIFAKENMDEIYQFYSENQIQTLQSQSQLPYEDVLIRDSNTSARTLSKISREKSFAKTTSLMKQHSANRENSITNHENNFLNLEQDHEFSALNQNENDMDNDDFSNLIRIQNQKRTYATAGFGQRSVGQQSIKDKSLRIIEEKEGSERESYSQDNVDESPILDINPLQVSRKNDPKLTFNYNFETQMNELQHQYQHQKLNTMGSGISKISRQNSQRQNSLHSNNLIENVRQNSIIYSGSIRQNSNRSQTYSPNVHNHSSRSQFNQLSSSNQPKKSISSNFSNNKTNAIYQLQQIESPDSKSIRSRRKSTRKKSTRTGTKVSILPSTFQPFSGLENPEQYYGIVDFDKMQEFEVYQPHNNYTITIQQANRNKKVPFLKKLNKYVFSYRLAQRFYQLKMKSNQTFKQPTKIDE